MGIELMTSSLPRMRSTPELHRLKYVCRAENEVRTRDPQLGRLMLYQLSYFRLSWWGEQDSNLRRHRQQIYSLPQLATLVSPQLLCFLFEPIEGFEPTTPRLQITCSGQLSYIGVRSNPPSSKGTAKIDNNSGNTKNFQSFLTSLRRISRMPAVSRPHSARCAACVSWAMNRSGIPIP